MDDPTLTRARQAAHWCATADVWIGMFGTAIALPALLGNWIEMTPTRLAQVGLVATAMLMTLVGGLHTATAMRHRPANIPRGLWLAGVAALAIALPAAGGFAWELSRALRLDELPVQSAAVLGPAVVMTAGAALAAANLGVLALYGRVMAELAPEIDPGAPPGASATSASSRD